MNDIQALRMILPTVEQANTLATDAGIHYAKKTIREITYPMFKTLTDDNHNLRSELKVLIGLILDPDEQVKAREMAQIYKLKHEM